MFKQENDNAGFTVKEDGAEEWDEEEEYEESQALFNSGFRSVLKNNQSINTKDGFEFASAEGGPNTGGPGAIDFKKPTKR